MEEQKKTKSRGINIFILTAFLIFGAAFLFFPPTLALATTYVDGDVSVDTTWTLSNSPYVVDEIYLNRGVTLTIEPGVIVKFEVRYSAIFSSGNFVANGTSDMPIYFTSFKNDAVGGDTNGDGSATHPAPGDWDIIYILNNSQAKFDYVVIDYGGCSAYASGIYNEANLTVSNSKIRNNKASGIYQAGGNAVISNSEIYNQPAGFYLYRGSAKISQSSIHDNSFAGVYNSPYGYPVDAISNWWGDSSGPYHPTLNSSGKGNRVSNGVDFIPWLGSNPLQELQNQLPQVSDLGQFKSDETTQIVEGNITTENTVVFKAPLSDPDNDQVKLQIEIKEFNQLFDGNNLVESDFIPSGNEALITKSDFSDGIYKWRARAADSQGGVSDWQEFGEVGNVDFEIKIVPLYTQIFSKYPSEDETKIWSELDYAQGLKYGCGLKIKHCGCAITSVVMVARYYGITETQGADVNPGEINNWLKNEPGGYNRGDINWYAAAKYTNWRIKYEKTDKIANNYTLLDEYLNKNQPVIIKEVMGTGKLAKVHFTVIDNKLASTYGVKDPVWYNTKTLDETTNKNNYIMGYKNDFNGLRIYKKGDGIAQSSMVFVLGSPAELLITDPQGRKLGIDQNNIEYNEIPDALYFEDGIDDLTEEEPPVTEKNKDLYILEPLEGEYKLEVVGTGEGQYSLYSSFYDNQGNPLVEEFHSETASGNVAQYNIFFDSSNSNNNQIKLFDETSPEAEIFFDKVNQQLLVKGTDKTTVNPAVSCAESGEETICQIEDEAKNITKVVFNKLKQEGKEIKAEFKSIQYNDQSPIKFSKSELKYEWSIDKKTGEFKNFEQKISVKDQFDIQAKYNNEKDETKIKTKLQGQKEQEQILSGMAIIKLVTKNGVLDFNF